MARDERGEREYRDSPRRGLLLVSDRVVHRQQTRETLEVCKSILPSHGINVPRCHHTAHETSCTRDSSLSTTRQSAGRSTALASVKSHSTSVAPGCAEITGDAQRESRSESWTFIIATRGGLKACLGMGAAARRSFSSTPERTDCPPGALYLSPHWTTQDTFSPCQIA